MVEEQVTATAESEMARLSLNGQFSIEVTIVNACQGPAQFFAAEIREHQWWAFADHRRFATCYGYGTGETVLAALAAAERVALGAVVPGYVATSGRT